MKVLVMYHCRQFTLLAALTVLAGCDQVDPYTRPGDWHPLGANAANLRAMVANPADLDRGVAAIDSPGDLAALAADRAHTDRVKKLPESGIAQVQINASGSSQGSSGGGDAAASQ